MGKRKIPEIYFSSDWHMGHWSEETGRGIITFERTQFENIQEHDNYIENLVREWAEKWVPNSILYYLGDFGEIEYLYLFGILRDAGHKVVFIAGNHDAEKHYDIIRDCVDEFHEYPIFLSKKLAVSHEPIAVWKDTLNISGHLHGSVLNSDNYINANIHVNGYKPVRMQQVNAHFSKLPKYSRRFLYEPWCDYNLYKITQKKEDVIADKDGIVDISASRLLQQINSKK